LEPLEVEDGSAHEATRSEIKQKQVMRNDLPELWLKVSDIYPPRNDCSTRGIVDHYFGDLHWTLTCSKPNV
jgi:hypothetical protein